MARANSFRVAPEAKLARTSRSRETLGSPASILATLDWLEPRRRLAPPRLKWRRARALLNEPVKRSLISTHCGLFGVNSRNLATEPVLQPASFRRFFFAASITTPTIIATPRALVILDSFLTCIDNRLWGRSILLREHFPNHYRVVVDSIDSMPCLIFVRNTQFTDSAARSWALVASEACSAFPHAVTA